VFTLKYCDNDIRKHEKYLSTTLGKMFKDNICGFEVKVLAVCDDLWRLGATVPLLKYTQAYRDFIFDTVQM